MSLKTELENIKAEISEKEKDLDILRSKKIQIEKSIINETTGFVGKFRIWYNSDLGEDFSYIPQANKFPLLRKFLQNFEGDRRVKYTLEDLFEDSIYALLSYDENEPYDPAETDDALIKYKPILKEAMENNFSSFVYDW